MTQIHHPPRELEPDSRHHTRDASKGHAFGARSSGHMLLVAIILVTTLSLMMAMAMQPLGTAGQRLKEQELMYRGQHMADGIRRFYLKFGRFPFSLEEMVEQEPRFVRKVYIDPMTEDGEWELVYLTSSDLSSVKNLNRAAVRLLEVGTKELDEPKEESEDQPFQSAFRIQNQQITGIRSKSDEEGLLVYQDSQIYSDWLFSALPQPETTLEDAVNQLLDRQNKTR